MAKTAWEEFLAVQKDVHNKIQENNLVFQLTAHTEKFVLKAVDTIGNYSK